jgi:hypothetical protein
MPGDRMQLDELRKHDEYRHDKEAEVLLPLVCEYQPLPFVENAWFHVFAIKLQSRSSPVPMNGSCPKWVAPDQAFA